MTGRPGPTRKLTDDDLAGIFLLLAQDVGVREIARRYKCAHSRISEIKNGKSYKWMARPPVVAECLIHTEINETGSTPVPSTIAGDEGLSPSGKCTNKYLE